MGVKQYIGARYVPLLDDDYNPEKEYEPLTTVNYGQATYTSKKKVPAGILPTDKNYWMQTGFGSQAVSELQSWKDETVDPFMQQTENNIETLNESVSNIEKKIIDNERTLNENEILLIVDSFGQNPEGNVITGFNSCLNGQAYSDARGGANFRTFAEMLDGWSGNKNTIKSIILCGGSNTLANPQDISAQFESVAASAASYPNANIFVAFIASVYSNPDRRANVQSALSEIIKACSVNGFVFLGNFNQALYPTFITIGSDGTHPEGSGGNRIGTAIFNKYANDNMAPLVPALQSATDENGIEWTFIVEPDGSIYVIAGGTTTANIPSGSFIDIPIDGYYIPFSGTLRSVAFPLQNGGVFILGIRNDRVQYYYAPFASGQANLPSGTLIMPQATPLVFTGGLQGTTNL